MLTGLYAVGTSSSHFGSGAYTGNSDVFFTLFQILQANIVTIMLNQFMTVFSIISDRSEIALVCSPTRLLDEIPIQKDILAAEST
jgi:hypothetical protein